MNRKLVFGALTVALVLSATAFATADIVTYPGAGNPSVATGPVTVKATVNPKISLTIDTPDAAQTVDFGTVDPGATPTKTVTLTVNSNKSFSWGRTVPAGLVTNLGLSNTPLPTAAADLDKGAGTVFSDVYALNVPWGTDPGNYTGVVQYTVTQD